ncbi:MAG: DUF1508 domain-containing protein [Planctomycetia bacterium]|nr:DUF1508 domain-containing protein [Planctomycetia bacterium]
MRKLFHAAVLFAGIAMLFAFCGLPSAPAQKKDKDEVGTVEIYQAKDGWRFRVKNSEGKSIAIGTVGYEKKEDCEKVVEFLKTTMAKAKPVIIPGKGKEKK